MLNELGYNEIYKVKFEEEISMYFKSPKELKSIDPFEKGTWNKEYLYEYLVWSCYKNFKNEIL